MRTIGCWMRLQLMLVDMLQFHGQEPCERVTEVRERYGLPVMKAVAIAGPKDVARAHAYADVADRSCLTPSRLRRRRDLAVMR